MDNQKDELNYRASCESLSINPENNFNLSGKNENWSPSQQGAKLLLNVIVNKLILHCYSG